MANVEFDFPTDFMSELLNSDFEEICDEALKESAPILCDSLKSGCQSVIADKTRTELVNSFKVWKGGVRKTKTDAFTLGVSVYGKPSAKSTFTSTTSRGKTRIRNTTNNDIAWWLDHGRDGQPAKPFIDRATRNVEKKIYELCQKKFNEKVGSK